MRTYVAITLLSETLAPEAISALMGTDPDFAVAPSGNQSSRWEIRSTADDEASFSDHVTSVIERIRPFAERLRAGRTAIDSCCLDVGIYLELGDAIPPIALSSEQMNFLSKLGTGMDIDLYLPGEAEVSFDDRIPTLS
jgi:hypothetical protein